MNLSYEEVVNICYRHELWLNGEGGCRAVFTGCLNDMNLWEFNLSDADFSECELNAVKMPYNLSRACFKGAQLTNMSFDNSICNETDFTEAKLFLVNFSSCIMNHALFNKAHLRACNFHAVNLRSCQLKIFHSYVWTAYIGPRYTSIGCQFYSNKMWKSFDDERIARMSFSALDYWNENKNIIFMLMDSFKVK